MRFMETVGVVCFIPFATPLYVPMFILYNCNYYTWQYILSYLILDEPLK